MRKVQKGAMEPALFRKIVREAASYDDCKIVSPYLQNEPLLDKHLESRIREIKDFSDGRLSARIVTNGYLLNAYRFESLVEAGLDVISISINAHNSATYETVMGGLEFETTLKNLEHIANNRPSQVMVIVTFMVTSDNEHEVEEGIRYWSSKGLLCGAFGIGTMTGNVDNFEELKPAGAPVWEKECFVPMEATAIRSDGRLLLCCSDWASASTFGSIAEQSIFEIWNSARNGPVSNRMQ